MSLPTRVSIVEVGPRDGLQNETTAVDTAARIQLCLDLAAAGLRRIEAGSFVSPRYVSQMAGSAEVFAGLPDDDGVVYSALTPNLRGYEAALAAGVREVAVFGSASEGFSRKNINCSVAESLTRFKPVLAAAQRDGVPVRGYVSCVVDCPYDGPTAPDAVRRVAAELLHMGCYEISLGDTVGTGTPGRIQRMLSAVAAETGMDTLAAHFHDTYGQALANVYAALECGVSTIDSAVAGLGGCPYARGASGNLASEDLVYLLDGLGIESGVDLNTLAAAGRRISAVLGRTPVSRVAQALAAAT
ncbi:hydroxymethylglutaryl-CoA lyase [Granulosicoccaceae sp. 1_MG-2023]|nr:hydroxymethylglutaryl-CoA lyase [Granulosicoccaceae sp. 1_MG-2023]